MPLLPPRIVRCAAFALPLLLAALPAGAQPAAPEWSAPEPGDPIAKRKAANKEQVRIALEQLGANAASQKAHDDAVAAAQMQKLRDDAAYAAAMKEHEAQVAAYEAKRARWQEIVAACKRRDEVACVQTLD